MAIRIIAKGYLFALAEEHGDCVQQVKAWYAIARKAKWQNLAEVRQTFRHADQVGSKTVFNIKGNDYRLMVDIVYPTVTSKGRIYIHELLTHAEYDRGRWKDA